DRFVKGRGRHSPTVAVMWPPCKIVSKINHLTRLPPGCPTSCSQNPGTTPVGQQVSAWYFLTNRTPTFARGGAWHWMAGISRQGRGSRGGGFCRRPGPGCCGPV